MTRAVKPAAGISIFLPVRSKARTTIFLARETRPRISGMLRHPSQSSTVSRDAISISGLMTAINGTSSPSSRSSSSSTSFRGGRPATKMRRLSCTCGAARPTPWYSFILSNMSSMSCWILGVRISEGCSGRAFARRTGCPMRAIFKIDIRSNYMIRARRHSLHAPPLEVQTEAVRMNAHDPAFRFCPACGASLESRQLKGGEPLRPVCPQCGYVHYLDPKVAVGTVIVTAEQKIVLVRRAIEPGYGLWVFPGGYVDRGEELTVAAVREAREESGLHVRLDGLVNIYSSAGPSPIIIVYAASILSGELCGDDECLEARLFEPDKIPWNELAFRSTTEALRDYLDGVRAASPPAR